jgi:hypothetical protein
MSRPTLKLIVNESPSRVDLDRAWREAAWLFLDACCNGATKERLNQLAADFFRARDARMRGLR